MMVLLMAFPAFAGDGQIGTYTCYGLTGGDAGDLDRLPYADLNDKDAALVFVAGDATYFYTFDADSEAAESSPDVIVPDDATGDGRWILIQVHGGGAGADGEDAYVYIAYASDASGTGFTMTFNAALDYIAVLSTDTEIETPQASDFAGLWKNYKGATGAQGVQGPAGADGEDGAPGPQGDPGPAGADGADGTDGYSVLSGSGAPDSGLGVNGDWYIDTAAHNIYGPKAGGAWGSPTSLIGPQGETGAAGADGEDGAQGPQGDPGAAGADGEDGTDGITYTWRNGTGVPDNGLGINGDYYLDDATGDVYFKAAETYSVVSNIEGPQGDPATDDQTASEVPVTDSAGYFTGDDTEEIFAEIGAGQEVPADLTADFYLFGTTSATLNWGVLNDNRITGYYIYQADYPGDFATVYDFATSTNSYVVTGLEYDHDYQFKISSTNGVDESDFRSKIIVHVREDAGGASLDIIEVTGTQSLTAAQLTNSRIFLNQTGTATYTFGTAQTAYELEESSAVFLFGTTEPAYFDCQAGDKITFVAGEKTTMDDGDKMYASSPEIYDSFVVTPVKIGSDYQWLINCVSGEYEDGGP
jgi:hypothetical protein